MQRNILEYLEHTVCRVPDKIALSAEDGELTFRDVYAQARSIGTKMIRDGNYKQPIVVFMKKHPKTITAFLGAIYAGCYYVPLDADMPLYRIELILKNLNPAACICDDTTFSIAKELNNIGRLYIYDEIATEEIDDAALRSVRDRQIDTDPVYIVFTSGSTGIPKGVVGCHRAVIDYIENLCEVLKFDEDTVFGNQTPLYFDACLKEIIPTLKYGATTHLIPRKLFLLPVKLVEYLNEKKINTLCWVVSALTYISSFKTFDTVIPQHIKTIAFASEVFPVRQLNLWREGLPQTKLVQIYGSTETVFSTQYEVERVLEPGEQLPIGCSCLHTEVILVNEDGREITEPGMVGELYVRGHLALGYWNAPDETRKAFVQNPLHNLYPERVYRTGDFAMLNEKGELLFCGRKDSQIKHMGHRVEIGDIEAAAMNVPDLRRCCVIYDSDKKQLVMFYEAGQEISVKQIRSVMGEQLPSQMIPHVYLHYTNFPKNQNGKIDRRILQEEYEKSKVERKN